MKAHQRLYDLIIKKKYSDKEHLQLWIDKGTVQSKLLHSQTPNIVINLNYNINILIKDTASNEMDIFFLITWWLNIYQPSRKEEAFVFEVDPKNKTTADVFIQIPIQEKVKTSTDENGDTTITTCEAPVIIDDESGLIEVWLKDMVQNEEEQLV